jgi:hypothetical protein
MNLIPQDLISGYLDDTLSTDEQYRLTQWLKESPENARQFAQVMLLHDRLRGEHLALAAIAEGICPPPRRLMLGRLRERLRPLAAMAGVLIATVVVVAVLLNGLSGTPVSAAVELKRIIAASAQAVDRTYKITVEELALPERPRKRGETSDRRPPKPPMDGAVLHVRGGHQFVLVRTRAEGLPFVTGSNGRTSWAVRPDGPVRVSSDLTRFNRDVPGHEQAMPLISIEEGLDRLHEAYVIEILPVERQDEESTQSEEPSRLMVAVKKRGYRGPQRVEITYAVTSGLIRQMRFVEMPYGPDRLTLRMTLIEERPLGAKFFDHESHHDLSRTVEFEE